MDNNTPPPKKIRPRVTRFFLRLLASLAIVALAAALRIWPLEGLGIRLAYLTFYPAVMLIGVYYGVWFGVLTAIFSGLTIFYWSPTDKPFIADSGDWLGMAVFLVNCTMISLVAEGMIRARKRARIAQREAENANRAKSVFLATMSHELRTPLNAILGFSNLMRNDPNITLEQRDNLDIINRSGEHLLSLINDVLDMSKIEAGRIILENKPFDIDILVNNIVDMLEVRAHEKGLLLLLEQSPELPHFVMTDPDKLRQIITNLVGNAIKYTLEGSVFLRLNVQTKNKKLHLVIEVEDSGVGISKIDQQHVFEPFVQVGKAATQKGTGLGLAIVREYITLMGGSITVESELQKGSIFRAIIPVQVAESIPELLQNSEEMEVIGLEEGQSSYRVLIVEDQLENQLLLQKLLKNAGFTVMIAENGEEGIKLFKSFQPHFIWMDRRMPVLDGLEATRRIRALTDGKNVKIVAVTASAFSEQRDEMLAAGMDDFVRKPYRPAEIFDCMARLLDIRFTYKAVEVNLNSETDVLTQEILATLPEPLRLEMINSLILGDGQQLTELLQKIEKRDVRLAKMLAQQLDNFNYLPVLNLLESIVVEQ